MASIDRLLNGSVKLLPCLHLLNIFRGVDPLVFAVLCGISSGVVGFLLGGATFNMIWKSVFRQRASEMKKVIKHFWYPETSEGHSSMSS